MKLITYCAVSLFIVFCLSFIRALSNSRIHDFSGKCLTCHATIPDKDAPEKNLAFVAEIDKLCAPCHKIDKEKSHPINITLEKNTPLRTHLDKNKRLTCSSCHDVHKEDKTSNKMELAGLLWGHLRGRAFCGLCHRADSTTDFRHQAAVAYAHPAGKLSQTAAGALLDKFSTECLGCHDDTISKSPQTQVKQGLFKHGLGLSHPVGVDYPRSQEFNPVENLPKEIRLFNEKVGCLSCHEIYAKQKYMLVMDNRKSRLCLACHKK